MKFHDLRDSGPFWPRSVHLHCFVPIHAHGQDAATSPGRDIVMSKCFQCHTDSMFRDQRQERRSWEAAIYRMIGRGGLFTQEEIKLMADYLGNGLRSQCETRRN